MDIPKIPPDSRPVGPSTSRNPSRPAPAEAAIPRGGVDCLRIEDRRTRTAETSVYAGPPARLYEFCGDARRPGGIAACAGAGADRAEGILREFVDRGLRVLLDRRCLSLALPAHPNG